MPKHFNLSQELLSWADGYNDLSNKEANTYMMDDGVLDPDKKYWEYIHIMDWVCPKLLLEAVDIISDQLKVYGLNSKFVELFIMHPRPGCSDPLAGRGAIAWRYTPHKRGYGRVLGESIMVNFGE